MLEKDDRPLIERDRGAGGLPRDVDINRLVECPAELSTILDIANAFTSYLHLVPSKDPYEDFKRLGHVDLDNADDMDGPVPVDHLGPVEEGEFIIVSVKGHFSTLARVTALENGDAQLDAVSPLDR